MKKVLVVLNVIMIALLFALVPLSGATAAPSVNIKLLNPPPEDKPLELAVGESYTFDILVESDSPFAVTMAMPDVYYPGRSIIWRGGDRETQAASTVLHLTMTAKDPTAGLPAVCDWPEPGDCWPEGVAPASIVVGVRYKGGELVTERFDFAVVVP